MNARLATLFSLAANVLLALALAVVWQQRLARPAAPPPAPEPATPRATPAPSPAPAVQPAATGPEAFHWSRVESEDYRQYIANLRALGCPERLLRDMIVADLDALYAARRDALKPVRLPPWASADRHATTDAAFQEAMRELEEEQRSVTTELLGFPWVRDAIEHYADEMLVSVLLGYLPPEQAIQVMGLPETYEARAQAIRQRANNILLAEDRAELGALADDLEGRLAALLTPAQLEELMLRLHAVLAIAGDRHLEAAALTGVEAREVARLSRVSVDLIREEFIQVRDVTDEERKRRALESEAALVKSLGPEKAADLKRAGDDRFRQTLDFTRERNLPRQTAVQTYEIRHAAETEAASVRSDPQLAPETRLARLQELQTATAAALTRVIGQNHMTEYLGTPGEWLNELGTLEQAPTEGRD
jgi:hypothetical protein